MVRSVTFALTCTMLVSAQTPTAIVIQNADWRSLWDFGIEVKMQEGGEIPKIFYVTMHNRSDQILVGSNLRFEFQGKVGFLGSAQAKGQALREYHVPPHGSHTIGIKFEKLEFFDVQNRQVMPGEFFNNPAKDCQVRVNLGDMWSPKPNTESNLFVVSKWFPILQKNQ